MKIPAAISEVTLRKDWRHRAPYPPLGFVPFSECELGNGDTFGLYWPIGRENAEPIVAETWHDEWRVQPSYSSLGSFLAATQSRDDKYPDPPTLAEDPAAPRACFEAARQYLKAQEVESALPLLERAVATLPEYTDALALLWAQYQRAGRIEEAADIALRAVICPPSFGARAVKPLRWLRAQGELPSLRDDPIWQARDGLKLVFGGAKENPDYLILLEAIRTYISQASFVRASTLMQTYAELMYSETTAFQERYQFRLDEFVAWQIDVSEKSPHGSRQAPPGS